MKTNNKYNNIKLFLVIFLLLSFVIFPKEVTSASKNGLLLWYNNVLPVILPFMIIIRISEFLGIRDIINKIFSRFMKNIFNVSGYAAFPFIMGVLSGNPMGAKITGDLFHDKKVSSSEAEKILSFSSNAGVVFVIGSIGTNMMKNKSLGIFLFFVMLISSVITGIIFGIFKKDRNDFFIPTSKQTNMSFGSMLGIAIESSVDAITVIGGYIMFFSVLSKILEITHILDIFCGFLSSIPFLIKDVTILKGTILGILEITNGAYVLSSYNIFKSLPFISFIIGFGGLSIFSQSLSMLKNTGIRSFLFLFSKIINGIISFAICYILSPFFTKII